MRVAITDAAPEVAHGEIQLIDLIGREVTLRQESRLTRYSISANCEVLLNGERVKLRMLQPRDHVRVAYRRRGESRIALSIEAATRLCQSLSGESDDLKGGIF
jgi:hypothetical protein